MCILSDCTPIFCSVFSPGPRAFTTGYLPMCTIINMQHTTEHIVLKLAVYPYRHIWIRQSWMSCIRFYMRVKSSEGGVVAALSEIYAMFLHVTFFIYKDISKIFLHFRVKTWHSFTYSWVITNSRVSYCGCGAKTQAASISIKLYIKLLFI